MRNPESYPNTPPTPSDRFFLTEQGLRSLGALDMKQAVAHLREIADALEEGAGLLSRDAPKSTRSTKSTKSTSSRNRRHKNGKQPKKLRHGTICGSYRPSTHTNVPALRLCGLWLEQAGFDLGQRYEVKVAKGQLTIRAAKRHPE